MFKVICLNGHLTRIREDIERENMNERRKSLGVPRNPDEAENEESRRKEGRKEGRNRNHETLAGSCGAARGSERLISEQLGTKTQEVGGKGRTEPNVGKEGRERRERITKNKEAPCRAFTAE